MTYERARNELERTSGFEFQGSQVLVRRSTTLDRLAELRRGAGGAAPGAVGSGEERVTGNAVRGDAEVRAAA